MLIKCIFKVAKDFNLVTIVTPPTPSPPPPCSRPHSNEDIHMEPPIPAHMFSEAATQTSAPIPMVAISPPLPYLPLFSETVAKVLHPNAPPFVQGPTHAPQPPPKATQGSVSSKHLKWPYFTTHGSFRHQFFIETPLAVGTSLPGLVD
ncbi:hypothetical protein P691DRAFT_765357 [Macrolepiota fuliginosa MF-IS2]|uniref:Uncharacterized protein n=1 Tax=Macrolepiota fuliginosa MF-IS2 TaxID=1400762 RepID=A0A9P5X2Y9_9AGAR|nr:hypothetical protein P691DRAFT_765357 [Macrolepiota fuliginosa MF-IS2]